MELVIGYEGWKKQYFVLDVEKGHLVECFDTKEEAYCSILPDDKNFKIVQLIYKGYWCMPPKEERDRIQTDNE